MPHSPFPARKSGAVRFLVSIDQVVAPPFPFFRAVLSRLHSTPICFLVHTDVARVGRACRELADAVFGGQGGQNMLSLGTQSPFRGAGFQKKVRSPPVLAVWFGAFGSNCACACADLP